MANASGLAVERVKTGAFEHKLSGVEISPVPARLATGC